MLAPDPLPPVLTAEEASTFLRMDVAEILKGIRDGQLPGNHLGDQWRILTVSLFAWIEGKYLPPQRNPSQSVES
jgi:hypothetical protein